MEKKEEIHISTYSSLALVLTALLVLTMISVLATGWHLGAATAALALIIACIKAASVIMWFMHIKFESLLLKILVAGVFFIFALVVIITFIDYLLR